MISPGERAKLIRREVRPTRIKVLFRHFRIPIFTRLIKSANRWCTVLQIIVSINFYNRILRVGSVLWPRETHKRNYLAAISVSILNKRGLEAIHVFGANVTETMFYLRHLLQSNRSLHEIRSVAETWNGAALMGLNAWILCENVCQLCMTFSWTLRMHHLCMDISYACLLLGHCVCMTFAWKLNMNDYLFMEIDYVWPLHGHWGCYRCRSRPEILIFWVRTA